MRRVFLAKIHFDVYDRDTKMIKRVERRGRRFKVTADTEVDLFPISVLAEALDRTTQTIMQWERLGLFPKPMYIVTETIRIRRWYSRDQILGIVKLMKRYKKAKKTAIGMHFDKEGFLAAVREQFARFDIEETL